LFAILLTSCGSRVVPIKDVESSVYGAGKFSVVQVKEAIQKAAKLKGWKVKEEGPSNILLIINVRKHEVTVNVTYNKSSYKIAYVSSENMRYNPDGKNGPVIHRNYRKWITLLDAEIQKLL
jgi:hypothetical protein